MNETLTLREREQIQIEFDELKDEIDRMAGAASSNNSNQ
jgi:flagellin-like hook-associated protein FlgL